MAIKNGHLEIFKMLLEAQASVESKATLACICLMSAGSIPCLMSEPERPHDLCAVHHWQDGSGNTALMLAIKNDHLEMFKMLLEAKAGMDVKNKAPLPSTPPVVSTSSAITASLISFRCP